MSGISNYGSDLFAGVLTGAYGMPTTLYLALALSDVGPDHSGSQLTEPIDTAYARQEITMSADFWSFPASGVSHNKIAVTYPTTTTQWGPINYWVVTTALTEGSIVFWSNFAQGIVVQEGNALTIPIGAISVSAVVPETMF